ncbi:hypothetical protein C826_00928, partial [Helicobacter bilis WiWa]
MLLKSVFMGFLSFSILHADTLKECKTEADKISGCVEREYFSNRNLWIETPYQNGEREGMAKWYHENGSLASETPYKNGKIEGIEKWYYENGNLASETPHKNDEAHGNLKYYTEDKKLLATINAQNDKFISGKCPNNKA